MKRREGARRREFRVDASPIARDERLHALCGIAVKAHAANTGRCEAIAEAMVGCICGATRPHDCSCIHSDSGRAFDRRWRGLLNAVFAEVRISSRLLELDQVATRAAA